MEECSREVQLLWRLYTDDGVHSFEKKDLKVTKSWSSRHFEFVLDQESGIRMVLLITFQKHRWINWACIQLGNIAFFPWQIQMLYKDHEENA